MSFSVFNVETFRAGGHYCRTYRTPGPAAHHSRANFFHSQPQCKGKYFITIRKTIHPYMSKVKWLIRAEQCKIMSPWILSRIRGRPWQRSDRHRPIGAPPRGAGEEHRLAACVFSPVHHRFYVLCHPADRQHPVAHTRTGARAPRLNKH